MQKRILLISSYHGGSHQAWAEGIQKHSQHEVRILTLPAFFWKWRMHGGAITLARKFNSWAWQPDVILATDMLDLTTFLALTRERTAGIFTILYFHENQLTYPLPVDGTTGPMRRQKGERDYHYAFINIVSALAADKVFFNSAYHQDSFLQAVPAFLNRYPDYKELEIVPPLQAKSSVLPVGIDFDRFNPKPTNRQSDKPPNPPLILWNQRWEYDKNPAAFFEVLYKVQNAGIPFRLAVCGQNFRQTPKEFNTARERLADNIVHIGFANSEKYQELLWEADITISTANHEFFGISILEAVYCHTFPILPKRLSYVELMPAKLHHHIFYEKENSLYDKLVWGLANKFEANQLSKEIAKSVQWLNWQQLINEYDKIFSECRQPPI